MASGVAADAFLVAHRLGQCLTYGNSRILDRVVIVDMQITLCAHRHVDQRVAGQLVEHVIEEADAGLVVINPGAVEIDGDRDLGLGGLAGDVGCAHGACPVDVTPL